MTQTQTQTNKPHEGSGPMFVLVKTTYDRKTGKQLKSEIVREVDITEDDYYRPLVEILTPKIIEQCRKEVI